MTALRTLAEIEAAGAALPAAQGWAPVTQATADLANGLLGYWLPRLADAREPQAA